MEGAPAPAGGDGNRGSLTAAHEGCERYVEEAGDNLDEYVTDSLSNPPVLPGSADTLWAVVGTGWGSGEGVG
ncbi:hypothetical protein GCM10011374_19840 [Kocuria dechangensis]|uniref:Uncharacterized protein n=1 Tax=Kocuria dechangensis TaxID=1176249 RepID=A0A917GTU5_9MICC|nr:hypothetical protein GCM10011374_19840 [Kocuria dechangensis]